MNNPESSNLLTQNINVSLPDSNENYELNPNYSSINNQLLFIDSSVEDYQVLIDNLVEQTEVVILDNQQDGIVKIAETLSEYDDLDAVHVVSHGKSGELFLGNSLLNRDALSEYKDELENWGDAIKEEGDILLYGCNIAADLTGAKFVEELSGYIEADILASDDLTGSDELGGNWDLEYATGDVETETIFDDNVQALYDNLLYVFDFDASLVVQNFAFSNPDSFIGQSYFSNPNFLTTQELAFNYNDLIYVDDRTLKINIDSPRFGSFSNANSYVRQATVDNAKFNSFLYGFTTESLNFNYDTFDFSSVSYDSNSITFGFDKGFDLSGITKHQSIKFDFLNADKLRDGAFKYSNDTVNLDVLSFDAENVTFTSSSVSFEYEPGSLNYNSDLFKINSNLFDYKLIDTDKVSFTESDFSFNNFNASDYRALQYAFEGDELFDPEYYLDYEATPFGMNPFTDYMENGYKAGLNPHPLFDVEYYLSQNPDVRINGYEPLTHYATVGFTENHENRDPHPLFDTSYYNENNPDVAEAGEIPVLHYSVFGDTESHENRDPNRFFDNSYYNANNPDVEADSMTALEHWSNFGYKESRPESPNYNPNRNPSLFLNATDYYVNNDDVRIASYELPSANPNQHLLEFGLIENRVTHEIFKSDNIVVASKEITANSKEFEPLKYSFSQIGVDLSRTDDGNIEVSQIGNFAEKLTYKVGAFLFTFVAGAVIGTYKLGQATREFVDNRFNWELSFDPQSMEENSRITISTRPPTGTPPFPEFRESPIQVAIFQLDKVTGIEDIEFIPLDDIDLPNVLKTPLRDEFLEDLLNGGLFLGGQTIPQDTLVVFSSSNDDLFAIDINNYSNVLGNNFTNNIQKENRTSTYETTTLLGKELPVRESLPPRVDEQGKILRNPDGSLYAQRTHGVFIPEKTTTSIKYVSGQSDVSNRVRENIFVGKNFEPFAGETIPGTEENITSLGVKTAINKSFVHAEGHAASNMRELGLEFGQIVINNVDGPCPNCITALPRILPPGATLEVIYTNVAGKVVIDTFIGGQLFNKEFNRKVDAFAFGYIGLVDEVSF